MQHFRRIFIKGKNVQKHGAKLIHYRALEVPLDQESPYNKASVCFWCIPKTYNKREQWVLGWWLVEEVLPLRHKQTYVS